MTLLKLPADVQRRLVDCLDEHGVVADVDTFVGLLVEHLPEALEGPNERHIVAMACDLARRHRAAAT